MGLVSVSRILKLAFCAAAVVAVSQPHFSGVAAQDAGDAGVVVGWADEGDSSTVMCVQMFKFLLDNGGVKIQDGEVATGSLLVNPKYVAYADAMLKGAALTGQGVTTNIDSTTGKVTLRTDGGAAQSNNGELIDLNLFLKVSIDAFAKDLPPVCKDILVKRLVVASGAGGGVGDPHLTTLDHVNYDFQKPGVFRLFESNNLLVQVFQHKCTPVLYMGERGPSCYQGVAVAFAGSVAKFFIANDKITLGKGTSNLEWLSVHKLKNRNDGYRVFTKVDESTYVDIMLTRWINNYPLLNVALRVSPYFKDPSVHGLLGNWNGVKTDDIKDNNILAQMHGFSLIDNLFTCSEGNCEKYLSQPTEKDYNAVKVPSDMKLLHQGYTPVLASDIPVNSFTPVLTSTTTTTLLRRRRVEDNLEYAKKIEKRARELCYQVFNQTSACAPYVTNTTNYLEAVCIGDSIMVGDLSIVDNTKISYLRDCRREFDARIESNVTTPVETAQLMADRTALYFGDTGKCPNDCSGHGSCLAAACKCDLGFTGFSCDIVVY